MAQLELHIKAHLAAQPSGGGPDVALSAEVAAHSGLRKGGFVATAPGEELRALSRRLGQVLRVLTTAEQALGYGAGVWNVQVE